MTPVFGHAEAVVPFVARLSGVRPDFGNCRAMAVIDRDDRMVAGIVFHNWSPDFGVMEVSAAATDRRWAARGVLNTAFDYAFSHAQLVVARTDESNVTVRRLWKAFGATELILPRLRGRTANEALLMLTDDAWANSRYRRKTAGTVYYRQEQAPSPP